MTRPRRRALDVVVPLGSAPLAETVARALSYELDDAPPRTRVTVRRDGAELHLHIEADDARGLRAGAHSYLRGADTAISVARTALGAGESFKRPA